MHPQMAGHIGLLGPEVETAVCIPASSQEAPLALRRGHVTDHSLSSGGCPCVCKI